MINYNKIMSTAITIISHLIFIGLGIFGIYIYYTQQNILTLLGGIGILYVSCTSLLEYIQMSKTFRNYLIRWQLSTFVLAPVMWALSGWNPWVVSGIANLIGGVIFYPVDTKIFNNDGKEK